MGGLSILLIPLLAAAALAASVRESFPPPTGAEPVPANVFARWLMEHQVLDRPVRTYNGALVSHSARPIDLPLVPGDLQQCADSAIRLRAEWLKQTDRPVAFHATSGDPIGWDRFQLGEQPYENDGRIAWKQGSDRTWESYLSALFTWAGTRSLVYDTMPATDPRPGDLLVDPGSPGHAVVLMDVAKRGEQTLVLVGEGFMPAQDFHIEIGPVDGWWVYDDGVELPHWSLPGAGLRRWPEVPTYPQ